MMRFNANIRQMGRSLILAVLLFFVGCVSMTPPVKFYTLTPMAAPPHKNGPGGDKQNVAVGVGPLTFPKILDRPQIVTRISPNRLHVAEFYRWGGSLREDFLTVLTANLALLLDSNRVAAYPWGAYLNPSLRLFLDVHCLDGTLGKLVALDVTWTITGPKIDQILLMRRSRLTERVIGGDYEDLVAAKSRILAALSREMAQAIKNL
jgi:uncharacterized lipoprotein YmbA